ncbi:DUF6531 domain-containing protein [Streptacidiphilus neutrinimicus]|uniref:DUF6531 domain-containing protein n=1 Tax=Streptacidiphilus neutrinimicus TaxID=105420 RepID=UPI001269E97A|nr:DUF6531 domain-containing protein [Streptacidiphilus neutrinimicus]
MGEIAKAFQETAQKAGKGLAEDFANAYHGILKDTEHGTTRAAENAAENEANTVKDLARSAEKDAHAPRVGDPARPEAEGGHEPGAGLRGGSGPGDEGEPGLGAGNSEPGQPSEGNGGCTTGGDPVDVVSGQMITSATDLHLPGLLPLVLRRAYASGYAGGRLLGPGWSSTLDQRLQVDADGIRYAGDDAQTLHYPLPTPDRPRVLPVRGARWPLTWDGPDGTIRIEDPDTGWTRHFDAPPTAPNTRLRPLTAMTDRNGHRIEHMYVDGLPAEVRHSGGYRIAVDTAITVGGARITGLRLIDGSGDGRGTTLIGYDWDGRGRLVGVVNSSGQPLSYTWDERDRITGWTDRNGHWYAYEYGPDGRVSRGYGTDGILDADFAYDLDARSTTVTDSLGHSTVYAYDAHGHLTTVTDPLGHTVCTEHDRYGGLLARTDELGRTTRYTLDEHGDPVVITAPDGSATALTYTSLRRLASVTQAGIRTAAFEYDERGNLLSATDASGARTVRSYDDLGRLTQVTDPLGQNRSFTSNPAGLVTTVTDPLGNTAHAHYDAFGRLQTFSDPMGGTLRLRRRTEGEVTERIHPDGSRETWEYDRDGNVVEHRDQAGAVTRFTIGPFGRLDARLLPDGELIRFRYDTELQLTEAGGEGASWSYAYDDAGHLISETDLNGRTLTYRNDGADQLLEIADDAGHTTAFSYNLMGELVERRDDHGTVTTLDYDARGLLSRITGPDSTVAYVYDACGRVLAETVDGRTTSYGYDAVGRRVRRTTPSGIASTWSYDANGLTTGWSNGYGTLTFERDANGRETTRGLSPLAVLTQSWDACHRLVGQAIWAASADHSIPDAATGFRAVQQRAYGYRADGIPQTIVDQLRGRRDFALTPAGRVTRVIAETWTETYAYDRHGGIVHALDSRRPRAAGQGERHLTGSLLRAAGRTRYEYDERERLVRKTVRTLSGQQRDWRYTWGAQDQLVRVDTPQGEFWTYTYDPVGRRTAKQRHATGANGTAPIEQVTYAWDGTQLAEETTLHDGVAVRTRAWEWNPDGLSPMAQTDLVQPPTAAGRTESDEGTTANTTDTGTDDARFWAVVADLSGTPSELVAPDGTVVWAPTTDLWGRPLRPRSGPVFCPLGRPGQYHDDETGLAYNYFRYYDPSTGRYLSPDPLGQAAGPDPHAYVPNPLYWVDPLGLAKKQPSGMGGWYNKLLPANWTDGSDPTPYEVNHVPAKDAYLNLGLPTDLKESTGPAIRMEYDDHRNFISTGSGRDSIAWRAKQRSLIKQGKIDVAMKMDIGKIRKEYGTKYDAAIKEMVDSLPNNRKFQKYLKDNGWKLRTCLLQ